MSDEPAMAGKTALGRVRGLGPSGEGAHHWYEERLSAIAVLLLLLWLLVSLLRLPTLDLPTLGEWLAQPLAAAPMLLLVFAMFWHAWMGLKVIVEDYVHEEGGKLFWLLLIGFVVMLGGTLAAFAVLKVALAGAAG